jgi:hypothetical protein
VFFQGDYELAGDGHAILLVVATRYVGGAHYACATKRMTIDVWVTLRVEASTRYTSLAVAVLCEAGSDGAHFDIIWQRG